MKPEDTLAPDLAAAFPIVKAKFEAEYPGQTIKYVPRTGLYRPPATQAITNASGKSAYNGTTTFSKHQFFPAKAFDFMVIDADGHWVTDGADARYRWVGEQFKLLGFRWGGDFMRMVQGRLEAHPDWDHIEEAGSQPRTVDVQAGMAAYMKQAMAAA